MSVWLRYLLPNYVIQHRSGLIQAYEVWHAELNVCVGRVEKYLDSSSGEILWRTLDDRKNDWRSGFMTRESAAQDLVQTCPRALKIIELRRVSVQTATELGRGAGAA